MAREFSTSEIIRQKCSICGMNNKKYTELVYNGETCGYKLTCCNCNHVDTFIDDIDRIADHVYSKGREVCIHLTTCKNKTCPYYGKYPLWTAATKINDILNGRDWSDNCNCGNNPCTCNNCECNENNIKISDTHQLVINGYEIDKPKFH
jgi:hypothetical protein